MAYDTLVIGAGLSGLAAAIRLAQFDRRVVVLERHSLWGGLNSFYKLKGRLFDSGLHALTNHVPKGSAGKPLTRVLRQLRLSYDELELGRQSYSQILFPHRSLRFDNDAALFLSEVAREFPRQVDGLARLIRDLPAYDAPPPTDAESSARARLRAYFDDADLIEMLMCPLCIYGSAREDDLDWDQFAILFRAVFLEGFARPAGGIQKLLDLLLLRLRAVGGELRTNCAVESILVQGGTAVGVRLQSGEELTAERIFSSAGHAETMSLVERGDERVEAARREALAPVARLSFFESIAVLDLPPCELGYDATISFFNRSERFRYRRPEGAVDLESGVVCTPNNFARATPLKDNFLRMTALANHAHWTKLDEPDYQAQKQQVADAMLASAAAPIPCLDALPGHTIFRDTFTPRTIERYTGHWGGAVYGTPRKRRDGTTGIDRLSLIGTDQGMLGIVGALLSGITIANRHALVGVQG